jgi:hypothetical protein
MCTLVAPYQVCDVTEFPATLPQNVTTYELQTFTVFPDLPTKKNRVSR